MQKTPFFESDWHNGNLSSRRLANIRNRIIEQGISPDDSIPMLSAGLSLCRLSLFGGKHPLDFFVSGPGQEFRFSVYHPETFHEDEGEEELDIDTITAYADDYFRGNDEKNFIESVLTKAGTGISNLLDGRQKGVRIDFPGLGRIDISPQKPFLKRQ